MAYVEQGLAGCELEVVKRVKCKYPIPPKTVTKIEAVTNSVPQVDAQICSQVQDP
jgi:hypothetical protein